MKKIRLDLTGQRFGQLVVVGYSHTDKHGKSMWLCKCDCGNSKIVSGANLRSQNTKSCGCLHKQILSETATKHGKFGYRLYWIWHGMKSRCYNPNDKRFSVYGGRGITVCDEWRNSFEAFYEWAMSNGYADNLTIDRKDTNGNYCPENCRWITNKEQQNNRRNNRLIAYNGKTQTLKQWAEELGINYQTLYTRFAEGKPIEEVFGIQNK